ncbi:TonB-dependent siderophore receptor [Beijerinckia sp. L45]|uniref:TonB-dependent receptor n=1 Tax=Beijerinckia sp. L45 TaxID=1641855 RepID=UPI00131C2D75|nr:TonB-dependent receptor [Beijerinckia sp. L45]
MSSVKRSNGSSHKATVRGALLASVSFAAVVTGSAAQAQEANPAAAAAAVQLNDVQIKTTGPQGAYASKPQYKPAAVDLGPLGQQSLKDTPHSIDVIPEDLLVNQQVKSINDALRYLPSVEVRDQQGLEVSRPQSRGFQGSIVQNTRLDGLNIIGTTAIAAENLSAIEVLNGPSGSLYGPETPAGVFNYITKKPTDEPIFRYIESFDSHSVLTEQIDAGGHAGPDGKFGYRVNIVHGQGESFVQDSYTNRTLFGGDFDYHFDNRTVVELNVSHYATDVTGLPGAIVYDGGPGGAKNTTSSTLPKAIDPTKLGIGQPGAGASLITNTGELKFKHEFDNGWKFEVGGLYQDAVRNLFGISNTLLDNNGNYQVTKNFAAVPHFTIGSNEAALNGHFTLFGMKNEFTLGTNGYINRQYNYKNLIVETLNPLTAPVNLANPQILQQQPTPANGGQYEAGYLQNQSIITADTLHFNDKLAIQSVLNVSFLSSRSFSVAGVRTSSDVENGAVSPTESLIYTPTSKLTTYFTYASSIEQGDQAGATGLTNNNAILAPYHDTNYEVGAKYAVFDDFLVTLAGFRMTRPYAATITANGLSTFQVEGQQRNYGVELFGQGNITHELSVLGGVTYIDARLQNSGLAATNNSMIVGVPHWKTDINMDYHPDFFHGAALTGTVHYESDRAANNTNLSYADSFATLDLGARYSTTYNSHHATLRFQVINVTNTFYYSSIADGNIVGSASANTAYFGTPRTFQASLEVDF